MENELEKSSLFNLSVDEDMKFNLKEIAKWAKFLGVIGYIGLGLMIVAGVAMVGGTLSTLGPGMGVGMFFVYIVLAALYFYPVYTLFKFGSGMKMGLANNDQLLINTALRNLKSCFQYMGIITIILLCIYGIAAIIGLIVVATRL